MSETIPEQELLQDAVPVEIQTLNLGGRKTDYDPAFCDAVINFMSRNHSLTAFSYLIKVAPNTVRNWTKQFPEFGEAVEIGRAARVLALEKKMNNAKISGPAAKIAWDMAKNVAPDEYRDKVIIESESHGSKAIEELAESFRAVLAASGGKLGGSRAQIAKAQIIDADFESIPSADDSSSKGQCTD
jgi:hypothetical protein